MMAVGGNSWICIQIHTILLFLLILPGFLFGNILNFFFIQEVQSSFSLINLLTIEIYALAIAVFCILLFGIPSAWIVTSRDPYTNIRRKK
jgi:ABC-type antimicrobial peptide transport system permease subunit